MNDITVRPLAHGDLGGIQRLHSTRDGFDEEKAMKRTKLLEWIAFHNPFANPGEATYYVAYHAGQMVAYHGRMPVQFSVGGSVESGYFVHDLYVDPETRRKGLGLALTFALAQAIEEETPAFFCLYGMTPTNRMMQRRRGYVEIVADSYLKRINILKDAKRFLRFRILAKVADSCARAGLAVLNTIATVITPSHGVKTTILARFGLEVDALNERIRRKVGVCTLRTSAHLNWKYIDRPYPRETLIVAERNGVMTGYAVAGISPNNFSVGMLLDLMADPDDTASIAALVRASVRHLRKQNAGVVRCVMTDARFARILKRLLFAKESVGKTMMLGNLHKTSFENHLKDLKSWHMTRSESDCFMLSP